MTPRIMRNATRVRGILCFAITLFVLGCDGYKAIRSSEATQRQIDLERVLSWLPADTETLQVADGPFRMANYIEEHDYSNRLLTSDELKRQFESLTFGLFGFGKGLLEKQLQGKQVSFVLEASRHFRSPASLGELPYEGCAAAIFLDQGEDSRDAFTKQAAAAATRFEDIEGQKVTVFEEKEREEIWTYFTAFPAKGMVLVCTNKQFLQEMLKRMHGAEGPRALPKDLREWNYVNKKAQFWGLRHFDREQANLDPTSPFGGRKTPNFSDEEAVGFTYECDPASAMRATVAYLSGARDETMRIAEARFSDPYEPAMPGMHVQHQKLGPGVIQSTFDLSNSRSTDLFFFIFMDHLGHAIYV
jgi:hypothetical protein